MSDRCIVLILLSILLLGLTGCSRQIEYVTGQTRANIQNEKGFTGYVVDRKDDSILVVDPAYEDFSDNGGASRYYPAKWFSNAPDPQIGSYVEVWTDGSPEIEPYPGQARAEKIKVFPSGTPDGAEMNEADAVRRGLHSPEGEKVGIPVIEDVEFDASSGTWTVRMRNAMSVDNDQTAIEVKVDDVKQVEEQGTK